MGNDASAASQLIFGEANAQTVLGAVVSNPSSRNMLGTAVGNVAAQIPTGRDLPFVRVTQTPNGSLFSRTVVSERFAITSSGKALSSAASAANVGKTLYDAYAYIRALVECAREIE